MITARAQTPLLVVFIDLTKFSVQAQRSEDADLMLTLDGYYELVGDAIEGAGGILVKFIGDACLAVFPEAAADACVGMLLDLKPAVDRYMEERGWECRLSAKAHFGPVIAGPFGARNAKRFDVLGSTVNTTARLEARGVTISAEAFRKLRPDTRARFRKHTPPIIYIRAEDPRPAGRHRPA